jgi:RNA polymerase sigma-70 factor (ECF subfamily)
MTARFDPSAAITPACLDNSQQNPSPTEAELIQRGYRYALALTHHPEESEDLVQEAWLNLIRRYQKVESSGVLITTVRNLFIDQCRRKKVIFFESLDQPVPPALPDVAGEEPGLKGDLNALLGLLRPAERELLFLHYYEGRTADEIGLMLSKPRGTVLSSIHRAIAKVREAAQSQTGGARICNQRLLFLVLLMMTSHP